MIEAAPKDFIGMDYIPMVPGERRSVFDEKIPRPPHPMYRAAGGALLVPPQCWYEGTRALLFKIEMSKFEEKEEDRLFVACAGDIKLRSHHSHFDALPLLEDKTADALRWARGEDALFIHNAIELSLDLWIAHRVLSAIVLVYGDGGSDIFNPMPEAGKPRRA